MKANSTIEPSKFQPKKSDLILHRLAAQKVTPNVIKKSSLAAVKPSGPFPINLDGLRTMEDCYAKLVELVPNAESEMGRADLITCVIDYISDLEDQLLDVMDIGSELNLQESQDSPGNTTDDLLPFPLDGAALSTPSEDRRTPLKTLGNLKELSSSKNPFSL